LADSSGHDIETSYATASVKALLAQNCTPVYSPRESMKMINDVLVEILPEEKYLTACYMHLNRGTRIMTLVNAGHPPVVYKPKGKKPFFIKSQGDILGMFADATFGIKKFAVNDGDRFFIYSDGLVESTEKKISWVAGMKGFLSAFNGLGKIELSDIPNVLISRLFNGEPIHEDDIVLLCIEV
jgi:sigma-B regulation protein RsbU (phosphoserine phosphatase)